MKTAQKATIIKLEDIKNIRYPLSENWKKAAGLLKKRSHLVDPVIYQRKARRGWEKRISRQTKLADGR